MPSATFLDPGTSATQDVTTLYPTTSGTVASATDQLFAGPRSLKLSAGSPAVAAFAKTAAGVLADTGRRHSFRFFWDTAMGNNPFLQYRDVSDNPVFQLNFATDGTLRIIPTGATTVNGTTVCALNTWVRITVSFTITSVSVFRFDIYLNGNLEASATVGTLTRVGANAIRYIASAVTNLNCWYQDTYVDDGSDFSDPGDVRVTYETPAADGTANQFTTAVGGASGAHFDDVAQLPASDSVGWSGVTTSSTTLNEEYNVGAKASGNVDLTGATIVAVMGWMRGSLSSVTSQTGGIIVDGTYTAKSMTTSIATYTQVSPNPTTYPARTGTDIGMRKVTTTSTSRTGTLVECGILIAYIPSTREARLQAQGRGVGNGMFRGMR